ncbi:MAG: UDP-2,3-diacylglucosamine diphosphatase [Bacteroidales bacterium]|nr:UDP-2,3-diacylglucosamine diphosphatase [Bacteroidales bacterium]
MEDRKKIYFASDFHFGIPDHRRSLKREKLFVKWLDEVKADAAHIFLMGDIFDFWFEYKTVVPKGFVRLLGKLAEITDAGIPVSLFRGNHDVWAFNYFEKELNIKLYREPQIIHLSGKEFYLAHGDGLGPGDKGYKFLKKVFACHLNQWLFRWLHPDIGARMGLYFSGRSRLANIAKDEKKDTSNNIHDEMLYQYSIKVLEENPGIDYFIFGHRHLPTNVKLNETTKLIILGDWITNFTYAVFDGKELVLKQYNHITDKDKP